MRESCQSGRPWPSGTSPPVDLVFPSPTGYHFDDKALRHRFYAALKAAGLGQIRLHDLRHTFGTLGAAVWPLHDLQAYMGHADIQTTMVYVHHVPKSEAAAQLSRAVEAASEPEDVSQENVSRDMSRTKQF